MAPNKLLGATILAAAALLGGCAQQDQAESPTTTGTEKAASAQEVTVEPVQEGERPYEFSDVFPDGRKSLPKRHWNGFQREYAGSVRIMHPETGEDGRERDMMLHVKIRDRDDDYATRGWQKDDYLTFRVTDDFNEIRIIDTALNLKCDERDSVKDEIYGGTFTSANRKSRKHCNSYMQAYAEKLVEALNEGQEWTY